MSLLRTYKKAFDQLVATGRLLDLTPRFSPEYLDAQERLKSANAAFDSFRKSTKPGPHRKNRLFELDKDIVLAEQALAKVSPVANPEHRKLGKQYGTNVDASQAAYEPFFEAAAKLSPEDLRILNNEGEKLLGRPPFSL
jgi:hypothetical protein